MLRPHITHAAPRNESCTDEFKVAVDAWNGGAVDDFNALTSDDWTYSLSSTCSVLDDVPLLKSQVPEDLMSELDERGTFGAYPRVTFYEDSPTAVMPTTGCNFNFTVFFQSTMVPCPACLRLVAKLHPQAPMQHPHACLQVGTVTTPAITVDVQRFSEICTSSASSSSTSSSNQNRARTQEDLRCWSHSDRLPPGRPGGTLP